MRTAVTSAFLLTLLCAIVGLFWYQELQYALPTPVPNNYKPVLIGEKVSLPLALGQNATGYYLHFYNPECPCSLFNASHVRDIIQAHGASLRVIIVVPSKQDVRAAMREFGSDIQITIDSQQQLARNLGVYSTPQAAIVTSNHQLYYRGNYNRARYCSAAVSNYAELALVALLNGQPAPTFDIQATQSYGCTLPTNTPLPNF